MTASTSLHRNPLTRPPLLLRAEGSMLLAVGLAAYSTLGFGWGYLFLGFLADLTFVGYLAGPRVGAALYNAVHSTVVPLVLLAAGLLLGQDLAVAIGLIMLAHIGLDRVAGYGLKYPDAFGHTHLGR